MKAMTLAPSSGGFFTNCSFTPSCGASAPCTPCVRPQVEARGELLHHLDRLQPLDCVLVQRIVRRSKEVRVGLVVRAADAAAQLVQLRQAELVGAVDDDGVGGRNVDAGLYDGRAQ